MARVFTLTINILVCMTKTLAKEVGSMTLVTLGSDPMSPLISV